MTEPACAPEPPPAPAPGAAQAEPPILAFSIPAVESEILPAADRAIAALRSAGFVGRGESRLRLALTELLSNAVEHGCRFDPRKRVSVEVRARPGGRAAVTIADEGPGLDPRAVDRDVEAIPFSEKRGRGLALVKRIVGAAPAVGAPRNKISIEFDSARFI